MAKPTKAGKGKRAVKRGRKPIRLAGPVATALGVLAVVVVVVGYLFALTQMEWPESESDADDETAQLNSMMRSTLRNADAGKADAQVVAAGTFYSGDGLDVDLVLAEKYYRAAAAQGDAGGQLWLAHLLYFRDMYAVVEERELAPATLREVAPFALAAAESGIATAQWLSGTITLQLATAASLSDDVAEAEAWFRKAAAQEFPRAGYALGKLIEHNQENPVGALEWYIMAAERGDVDAQFKLGTLYITDANPGIPQNKAVSRAWITLAMEGGHPRATYTIADMLRREGEPEDAADAVQMYRDIIATKGRSASSIRNDARNALGEIFEDGEGVDPDLALAVKWFRQAAKRGHAEAQFNLGRCLLWDAYTYLEDVGSADLLNIVRHATIWLTRASNQGHVEAGYLLEELGEVMVGAGRADAITRAERTTAERLSLFEIDDEDGGPDLVSDW
eukprot:m.247663 g.247663  ORF g.247663 m.247663 type:complete len:449 (-) comp26458_c0_seq1:376-1722(-)